MANYLKVAVLHSVVLLAPLSLFLTGCEQVGHSQETRPANSKTAAKADKGPAAPAAPAKGYLNGWDAPALALMLSGEEHGYLEPCGCTENQLGGVALRADFARILVEEKKWNLLGFDVGGMLKRSRRQDQIKFEKFLDAFRSMSYRGIGVGVEELKLGADYILTRMINDPEELAQAPALISANVVLFDQADLGWPLPYRIVEKGGVKVGVTSVFGPSLVDKVAPKGVNTNITIKDPSEVLPRVIKELQAAKPDFMMLLCHGTEAEAKKYATAYPQFRIILAADGFEEPDGKPVVIGKTWILNAGHKGKRVGILGYYPKNTANPFKFELVTLDKKYFKSHPAMVQLMKDYQQQLQDERIAESDELLISSHPSGAKFIGAAKCGDCHPKAHAQWKDTPHASAFTTLKEGPWHENRASERVGWIPRQFDPECLSCHVTGWHPQEMLRYGSGYLNEQASKALLGQQCENCHGPGSVHVASEEAAANMEAGRKMVRRTLEEARKTMCVECHDPDNSPKFTPDRFKEYWDQVKHPFKD